MLKCLTTESSFWDKVDKSGECWVWLGYINRDGYGVIGINYTTQLAHRIAYEFIRGKIPQGLVLDHLCRNPACVNPEHLEAVTQKVNIVRGETGRTTGKRNLAKTHCKNDHPYNDGNTYYLPNKRLVLVKGFGRDCKTCRREAQKRYRLKKLLFPN